MFILKLSENQYINTFNKDNYKKNLENNFKTLLVTYWTKKSNLIVGAGISDRRTLAFLHKEI